MEQKRVSFKIAKVIKEAGYPQDINNTEWGYALNEFRYVDEPYDYDELYNYHRTYIEEFLYFPNMCKFSDDYEYCVAPTYLDVWLWLWREKKCNVTPIPTSPWDGFWSSEGGKYDDPEEAIIAAIEYLIDNDLIK